MKNTIEWSPRLCRALREIAEQGVREREILARCREILARGVQSPPDVTIALDADCIVVTWQGREVAREREDIGRRFFEDGPWVAAIEELSETFEVALPMAA
jgi:hypothetical protein